MTKHAIAIVGMDALFPQSLNTEHFWQNIVAGKDLITDIPATHWLIDDYYDPDHVEDKLKVYCKRGGFLPDVEFDPLEFGIPPATVPATDTSQLLSLIVAKRVLQEATNNQLAQADLSKTSVILGATGAQELMLEMSSKLDRPFWTQALRKAGLDAAKVKSICDDIEAAYVPWSEATFPGLLGNVIAGRIANRFNTGGTNCVVDAACASSFSAIAMAIYELQLGQSDLAIAGGVDTINGIAMHMCFTRTPALSFTNHCRPFSNKADGTLLGEGVCMMALKRLEDAEKDGNKIYAVIKGVGTSSDGKASSIYAPVAKGQAQALHRAYEQAGYFMDSVGLIEAHGTATIAGDSTEIESLQQTFKEHNAKITEPVCALGSVKSQMGHTKSAAGAGGLFKIILALHQQILPPTINVDEPNPKLAEKDCAFYVNTQTRPWINQHSHPRRASVSSFGFGGTNFHLALEEYTGKNKAKKLRSFDCELLVIASEEKQALLNQITALLEQAEAGESLAYLAYQSQLNWNQKGQYRLAIVSHNIEDLKTQLLTAQNSLLTQERDLPNTIYYSENANPGKTALLFPGQGSQYINMGAELAMAFPQAFNCFQKANDALDLQEKTLADVLFPIPVFSEAERLTQQANLTQTQWAQPAIGACSLAQLALFKDLKLEADYLVGHSFGELTALYAAGVYDESDFIQLAQKRGHYMAQASQKGAKNQGAMTAVLLETNKLEPLIKEKQLSVKIANYNSPKQNVITGNEQAIIEAEQMLSAQNISFQRLPVSAAFHSEWMQPAANEFKSSLKKVKFKTPKTPVYANATADLYSKTEKNNKLLLERQITEPVRFQQSIEQLYEAGVRTFIEVGPQAVLTGLVNKTLSGKAYIAIAMDHKGTSGVLNFCKGLAQCFIAGLNLDFTALWQPFRLPVQKPVKAHQSTMLINGTNYGKPYPPKGGGARDLPIPNYAEPVDSVVDGTVQAVADENLNVMNMEEESEMLSQEALVLVREMQQQLTDAQNNYQKAMTDSHIAFLNASQTAIAALNGSSPASVNNASVSSNGHAAPVSVAPAAPAPAPVNATPEQAAPVVNTPPPAPVTAPPAPAVETKVEIDSPVTQDIDVASTLLDVVADKTGYPKEMLNLDMDMEADLGIDSIKQVEILAGAQDQFPNMPELDPADLADIKTLQQVVDYINGKLGVKKK